MTKNQAKILLMQRIKYDPISSSGLTDLNGLPVGTLNHDGYWLIASKKWFFSVHVLIWEMHNGPVPTGLQVDHENTNRGYNVLSNLRLATQAQNSANAGIYSHNTTGIKDLSFNAKTQAWRGQIMCNGKSHSKTSKDRSKIENWLIAKRNQLHGQFARHS